MKERIIEEFAEKLAALFEMRTALAIAVCVIFCVSVVNGTIGADDVKNAFWMVLGWYAGTNGASKTPEQRLPVANDG